jgi:hypothetical protein
MTYSPPGVSRWYRWDWQYASDLSKIPFVQEAALLISITPALAFLASAALPKMNGLGSSSFPVWMLWSAAMAFVFARLLYYVACPKFVQEYRDFGQYAARQHSHRWIVWEFYHNLQLLSGWRQIVKETSPKGLTIDIGQLPKDVAQRLASEFGGTSPEDLKIFSPVNIDRDIYLPIYADGKKLTLGMREADPDLPQKEKELFWILYSQAVKERPIVRGLYWILVASAVVLLFFSAAIKIYFVLNHLRP